ncbi:hypothetical protein ACLBWS_10620 [Brucellaceae bacterium D45D]
MKPYFLFLLVAAVFATPCLAETDYDRTQEAAISKKGSEIYYTGDIEFPSVDKFKALYDPSIKTVVIKSGGGEVTAAMDLGFFIHRHKLDVHVREYCFSSCANYIFPAGETKYLDKNSLVGWHGSSFQTEESLDYHETGKQAQPPFYLSLPETREMELRFYTKLHVEPLTPIYGLDRAHTQHPDCVGWTYSLKAMKQLNIRNIVLNDKVWEPPTTMGDNCVFKIDHVL